MWRFDTSAEGEFSCHLHDPELERIINELITIGYKDRLKIKGIKTTYKTRDGFAFKPKFLVKRITVLERYLNQQGNLYSSTLAPEKPPAP